MGTIRPLLRMTALVLIMVAAPGRAADKLKVVATTPDLAAVARAVGGDDLELKSHTKSQVSSLKSQVSGPTNFRLEP